jgi:hypothetical protein
LKGAEMDKKMNKESELFPSYLLPRALYDEENLPEAQEQKYLSKNEVYVKNMYVFINCHLENCKFGDE